MRAKGNQRRIQGARTDRSARALPAAVLGDELRSLLRRRRAAAAAAAEGARRRRDDERRPHEVEAEAGDAAGDDEVEAARRARPERIRGVQIVEAEGVADAAGGDEGEAEEGGGDLVRERVLLVGDREEPARVEEGRRDLADGEPRIPERVVDGWLGRRESAE